MDLETLELIYESLQRQIDDLSKSSKPETLDSMKEVATLMRGALDKIEDTAKAVHGSSVALQAGMETLRPTPYRFVINRDPKGFISSIDVHPVRVN